MHALTAEALGRGAASVHAHVRIKAVSCALLTELASALRHTNVLLARLTLQCVHLNAGLSQEGLAAPAPRANVLPAPALVEAVAALLAITAYCRRWHCRQTRDALLRAPRGCCASSCQAQRCSVACARSACAA